MGKQRAPSDGSIPSYPATVAYKQWAWDELHRRGWTLQRLVDEMKRADRDRALTKTLSTSTLTQFLGAEYGPRVPSNTTLMPLMNKALGLAAPPLCDPSDPLSQIRDRFAERWKQLSQREQRVILELLTGDPESDNASAITK